MKKRIVPMRAADAAPPPYPSLRAEWERRGATRRGFLTAALAGAAGTAGAMTGCMGAPPRPRYPQKRWLEITIRFERTVTFSGCSPAVERQGFVATHISTQSADLVRRLQPRASRAALGRRLSKALSPAVCHHSTMASFRAKVERVLHDEVSRWYRMASGATLRPDTLRVKLRSAVSPPPSPRKTIATD